MLTKGSKLALITEPGYWAPSVNTTFVGSVGGHLKINAEISWLPPNQNLFHPFGLDFEEKPGPIENPAYLPFPICTVQSNPFKSYCAHIISLAYCGVAHGAPLVPFPVLSLPVVAT